MQIKNLHVPLNQLLKYDLNSSSILLYSVILYHAYHQDCITTNKTLADELGISERTVQNSLKELKDKDCIKVEIEKIPNGSEIRHITPLVLFDMVIAPGSASYVRWRNRTVGYNESDDSNGFAGFEVI